MALNPPPRSGLSGRGIQLSVLLAAVATVGSLTACSGEADSPAPPNHTQDDAHGAQLTSTSPDVELLTVTIEDTLSFDESSFTQGLEVGPDYNLYVGTGKEGESRIYRTTPEGEELASADLDPAFFGEGITRVGGTVWQLTWKNNTAIKRDARSLEEIGQAKFNGEGWGICFREADDVDDGRAEEIIFSDGSAQLRRMDPDTLEERERFTVTLDDEPLEGLNELECVGDKIYANVFTTTDLVRIDAKSGEVDAIIDASDVPNHASTDPNNVLNGIAHIPSSGDSTQADSEEFYITGKHWPDLYRVTFTDKR